ncbi:MAG: hypothetical protein IJU86_02020, partial [Firmicutes bacterium]|nr:hypothetical protein [Bacillota bacterium]
DRNVVKLDVGYKPTNVANVAYKVTKIQDINNIKTTKETVDIFLPVILDENIEQSIEECERYNKLMWANYSKNLLVDENGVVYKQSKYLCWWLKVRLAQGEHSVYDKHKRDFENKVYTLENFKDQCKFYSALIDEFIEEHHLRPPERKRAWSVFFYVLMGLAIVFLGFCIFAPGLLISLATIFGISTILAQKIIVASYALAPVIALIFLKLARYISWKQNDYEKPFEIRDNKNQVVINKYPESYSKYNQAFNLYKRACVSLTGEKCKIEGYEYNYNEEKTDGDCTLFKYYHQEVQEKNEDKDKKQWKLKSNTKTPLELLLKLKKAYEIPEEFKEDKISEKSKDNYESPEKFEGNSDNGNIGYISMN